MQLYQWRTILVLENFLQHGWRRISSKGWLWNILIDCRLIEYLMIEVFRNDSNMDYKRDTTKFKVGEWSLLLCVMIENKGYGVELALFDDVWYNV